MVDDGGGGAAQCEKIHIISFDIVKHSGISKNVMATYNRNVF